MGSAVYNDRDFLFSRRAAVKMLVLGQVNFLRPIGHRRVLPVAGDFTIKLQPGSYLTQSVERLSRRGVGRLARLLVDVSALLVVPFACIVCFHGVASLSC